MNVLTERLAEALEVCEGATDGPWEDRREHLELARIVHSSEAEFNLAACMDCGTEAGLLVDADAEFIAHARTGYPAALRALQAVLELHRREVRTARMRYYCARCGDSAGWPCPTVRAITEHLGATDE